MSLTDHHKVVDADKAVHCVKNDRTSCLPKVVLGNQLQTEAARADLLPLMRPHRMTVESLVLKIGPFTPRYEKHDRNQTKKLS